MLPSFPFFSKCIDFLFDTNHAHKLHSGWTATGNAFDNNWKCCSTQKHTEISNLKSYLCSHVDKFGTSNLRKLTSRPREFLAFRRKSVVFIRRKKCCRITKWMDKKEHWSYRNYQDITGRWIDKYNINKQPSLLYLIDIFESQNNAERLMIDVFNCFALIYVLMINVKLYLSFAIGVIIRNSGRRAFAFCLNLTLLFPCKKFSCKNICLFFVEHLNIC